MTITSFDPSSPQLFDSPYNELQQGVGKGRLASTIIGADSYVSPGLSNIKIIYTQSTDFILAQITLRSNSSATASIRKINQTSYQVTFSRSGYAAFAVVPSTANSLLTLDQYRALSDSSNVIVISSYLAAEEYPVTQSARLAQSELLRNISPAREVKTPEISHSSFESKAVDKMFDSRKEASYSALGVSTLNKESHIDREVKSLLSWLESFSTQEHEYVKTVINTYQEHLEQSFESWASWQKTRSWSYGAGHTFSKSTTIKQEEAQSFRFNSGSVVDFYCPSFYTRCEDFTIQGRNFLSTADLNRQVSLYSWNRSEQMAVTQTKTAITYCTASLYQYGSSVYRIAGSLLEQAEQVKIQVTQELGLLAGQFNSTVDNNWVVRAGNIAWRESKGSSYLVSEENVFISSKQENHISSKTDTNIVAGANMYVSSQSSLNVSARGVLSLDGALVHIGMGGFNRPTLDLDRNIILGGSDSLAKTGITNVSSSVSITSSGVSINPSSATAVASGAIEQLAVRELKGFIPNAAEANSIGSVVKSAISRINTSKGSLDLSSLGLGKVEYSSASDLTSQLSTALKDNNVQGLASKLYAAGKKKIADEINKLFSSSNKGSLPSPPDSVTIPTPQELEDYIKANLPDFTNTTNNGWWTE